MNEVTSVLIERQHAGEQVVLPKESRSRVLLEDDSNAPAVTATTPFLPAEMASFCVLLVFVPRRKILSIPYILRSFLMETYDMTSF